MPAVDGCGEDAELAEEHRAAGGKVTWSEEIERGANNTFTYWLTIKNVGPAATNFEAKFARLK